MRAALECCHKGWGESCIIGVAASGVEISTRPFQLVTGRVWRGSAFGGTKGRSGVPEIVNEFLQGKIQITPLITAVIPLSQINDAFHFMKNKDKLRFLFYFCLFLCVCVCVFKIKTSKQK